MLLSQGTVENPLRSGSVDFSAKETRQLVDMVSYSKIMTFKKPLFIELRVVSKKDGHNHLTRLLLIAPFFSYISV